jgi:hypothetical protein
MIAGDIQEEVSVMENGRYIAEIPVDKVDERGECHELCNRTVFVTFDSLPIVLVIFSHSVMLLCAAEEKIVVSWCVYRLPPIIFNVEASCYFGLVREEDTWFYAYVR